MARLNVFRRKNQPVQPVAKPQEGKPAQPGAAGSVSGSATAKKKVASTLSKQPDLPKPNGRPPILVPDVKTLAAVRGLGSVMTTNAEAAYVLGVHDDTFRRFRQDHPEVEAAWESGRAQGRVSLRRSQFRLAEKNATMAIFLGMNFLDQKDLRGLNVGGRIDHAHTHTVLGTMLREIDAEQRGRSIIDVTPTVVDSGGNRG